MRDRGEEPIDPRVLNEQAADALLRARLHLGLRSRIDFAQLLNEATGGQGPDVSTYNRWEERTRRVPAWALPLAVEVLKREGKPLSISALYREADSEERPTPEMQARMERMERQMDRMAQRLEKANQHRDRVRRQRPAAG